MRKFLSISLSAMILSCIAFAPASTQQPAAPPAAKDAPPIAAKKEDFSKRPRGHKEPVTHEEKAIRLAKHIDSFARHADLHKKMRAAPLPASWDSRTQMTNGVSWIPPIVDQGQCLPGDTPILMADGKWKSIKDLQKGEKVITAEGNIAFVTDNNKRWVDEFLVLVKVKGGYEIQITDLHPVLTYSGWKKPMQLILGQEVAVRSMARQVFIEGSGSNWTFDKKIFEGLSDKEQSELLQETIGIAEAKGVFSPISELKRQSFKGFVYALEVDGDHTYVANHICVHNCGSCWDFSGTTICTTAFLLNQGPNAPGPLSEQYTLDCGQNGGCDGDDNTTVLAWAKATGLPTTAQYGAYQGQAGRCKTGVTLYKIADWGYCTPANTNAPAAINDIKAAIMTYGSVGSGIDASSNAFSNYTTGVFTIANSSNIDHDIALVGWKDDVTISGGGYWILRNSWSTSWGQAGYMYISYGSAGVGWEGVFAIGPTAPLPVPPAPPTPPTPPVPPLPPLPPAANVTLTVSQALAAGSYQIVAADAVTITGDMTLAQLFVALGTAAKQTPNQKCKTCVPLTVQPTVQSKAANPDKRLDDLYDRIVPKMFDSIEANQKSIEVLRNAIAGPQK